MGDQGLTAPDGHASPRLSPEVPGTAAAIGEIAARLFAVPSYDGVMLERLAGEAGLDRDALLHCFENEASVRHEIVEPFEAALDRVLAPYADVVAPLPPGARAALLTALVDAYCAHRVVLLVLMRDVANFLPLRAGRGVVDRIARLIELMAGPDPTDDQRVIVGAVIGVITRPLIDPANAADDATRRLILSMALDVAKRLGNEVSRSWVRRSGPL